MGNEFGDSDSESDMDIIENEESECSDGEESGEDLEEGNKPAREEINISSRVHVVYWSSIMTR